jgi:hypothetical protein
MQQWTLDELAQRNMAFTVLTGTLEERVRTATRLLRERGEKFP